VAGTASSADAADDRQDHVLGRDAEAQRALDPHFHRLRRLQQQGLRGEHMFDLAGADPESERADRPVRGGVAVAADDGGARQGEALFRPDDMDDALGGIGGADIGHPEFGDILLQRFELPGAQRIADRQAVAVRSDARRGRQVVIGHRQGEIRPPHLAAGEPQPLERLGRRHLVDEVPVDIDEAGAILATLHDMGVPDLFVQGAGATAHLLTSQY